MHPHPSTKFKVLTHTVSLANNKAQDKSIFDRKFEKTAVIVFSAIEYECVTFFCKKGNRDWKTIEIFQACFLMAISFQLNPEADLILVNNRVLVPS